MEGNPKSLIDKLVGASVSLLVAGAAVFIAVRLIEAVWAALLVILTVGLVLAVAVVVLRSRRGGW